jgi:hypothetical protein
MNPVTTYAKIVMAFLSLYRHQRRQASYTLAVAIAMSSILVVNIWSLLLLISLIDPGWLLARRRIGLIEYCALVLIVLVAELIFVDLVQKKASGDSSFGTHLRAVRPSIAMWYASVSVAVLAIMTGLAEVLS